ncbi:GNAT family N-acetyltransferase [Planococcus sp. CPCC 101016]|uniref:GNAT family N-acetyltransferase n=1 Tax=Planococcus sp. CPCC 101016 TaxID=2599617 RepID=UPI0011B741EE|nr:GNAT family N-acetyltransferase [Planococcus sp. CPCC 101016]TWT08092.1 GNAT family N-acetyltransferase [Planococcus sp. CPCC 101016]
MKTKLQQMTEEEFDQYLAYFIPDYAKDLSENFVIPLEKAMKESKDLMEQLLPNKQKSAGQLVYNIYSIDEDKTIGVIWYSIQTESNKAYIYHILIKEEFRKKGFATFVLQELEETMKNTGITSMGLNVFGKNPLAYKLYEKLGYQTQSTTMGKRI